MATTNVIPNRNGGEIMIVSQALTPAAVAANTVAAQAFSGAWVPPLRVGDIVLAAIKPATQAGLALVNGIIDQANGNVNLIYANDTGAAITPTAAETYLLAVYRP